jgi:putative SOS response-associated peptidase YedK
MCGRYRRTTKEEELARIFRIPIPPQLDLPISYNIAPSQNVLVIRFNPKKAQRSLDALGLNPCRENTSPVNTMANGAGPIRSQNTGLSV